MPKGRARKYRTIRELKHGEVPVDDIDVDCDECGRPVREGHADWCRADDPDDN